MLENLTYWSVHRLSKILSLMPSRLLVWPLTLLFRFGYRYVPRMRETALTNLGIAFPGKSEEWYSDFLSKNAKEIAYFVVDSFKIPCINPEWTAQNVVFDNDPRLIEDLKKGGTLMLGAHLGSFELMPSILTSFGVNLSIVVRPFKSEFWNNIWRRVRESRGVQTIDRRNGIRKLRQLMKNGTNVGILCDQNVTRAHACFPDWFNYPAATTKAPALLALNTNCPVWVVSIRRNQNNFSIHLKKLETEELKQDATLSKQEKIEAFTQTIADAIVEHIRIKPESWFWVHRRWKTRPEGEPETVYNRKAA